MKPLLQPDRLGTMTSGRQAFIQGLGDLARTWAALRPVHRVVQYRIVVSQGLMELGFA
jgi:hypothetical protein